MADSPKPQPPHGAKDISPARSKTASPAQRSATASPAGHAPPDVPTDQSQIEADDTENSSTTDDQLVPPNVKFVIDDVESPWVDEKYDWIFCRSMAGALKDWPTLVGNIFENVNPNGWAEFQDWDILYYSEDGTLTEDHHTLKLLRTFLDCCKTIGREARPGPQLQGWVENAGFKNVNHHTFKVPIGPWPKDPHYKDIGMRNLVQILEGLEAYYLRILTGVAGWSEIEVQTMLAAVRNEMKSGKMHASMKL
ncbi:putative methyltransferase tdiE [Colletotrichum trifolii]|uniref:Putative methyltransferase tdiE n=1 Tax=Colletotrichum trifolii TaxID=5466 RepID=A0A4R8RQ38_COLTR|nr:putative methyltransferase tdiE [Colletotrichum trifolii]